MDMYSFHKRDQAGSLPAIGTKKNCRYGVTGASRWSEEPEVLVQIGMAAPKNIGV